jgi:hypothetical protein
VEQAGVTEQARPAAPLVLFALFAIARRDLTKPVKPVVDEPQRPAQGLVDIGDYARPLRRADAGPAHDAEAGEHAEAEVDDHAAHHAAVGNVGHAAVMPSDRRADNGSSA